MLRIGLTGGIGAGKSTIAELFQRHGVPVIDADALAHAAMAPDGRAYAQVVVAFGPQIVATDGTLDRSALRARVFNDTTQRKLLESIVHPAVRAAMQAELAQQHAPYVILMIPLLIETEQRDIVDRVLVVDTTEELQLERVRKRGLEDAEIRAIMSAQADRAERLAQADDIIVNDGDRAQLARRVDALHVRYLALAGSV